MCLRSSGSGAGEGAGYRFSPPSLRGVGVPDDALALELWSNFLAVINAGHVHGKHTDGAGLLSGFPHFVLA